MPPRKRTRRAASAEPARLQADAQQNDAAAARLEEQATRIGLLEAQIELERARAPESPRGRGRRRRRSPSSSSSSPSSSSSSRSTSSASSASRSPSPRSRRSRSKKFKKSKSSGRKARRHRHRSSATSTGPSKWRNVAYEHQHAVNARLHERVEKVRRALKSDRLRSATKNLKKGEDILEDRQEWLTVADTHGVEVANKFVEGGGILSIVTSAEKSKRLNAAVQSVAMQRPFRGGGGDPIQVRQGRGGHPLKAAARGVSSHHNSSHLLGPARHQGRNRGKTPSSLAPKSASVAASQATSSISARSQPLRNSSEGCADGLPPDVIDDEVYSVLSVVDEGCVAGLCESDDQGELEGQGVVVGSLARCKPFWETMGASEFVLRIICEGYLLPFVQLPRPKTVKNHSSAQCQFDFVTDSIRDLMERGCIKEVKSEEAVICSPLGVVNNGKRLRLILDLRYVNTYLAKF